MVGVIKHCYTTKMWSATLKWPVRHKAALMVINNLLLQMEWLLSHLRSNRTRGNNTGKLMFTVACANESQVNNCIVLHFIKFHGNKQLFNTVFNFETSLTFAPKYDLLSSLFTRWHDKRCLKTWSLTYQYSLNMLSRNWYF